ncbi:DUF4198 domain-containing protein [Ampullimonas aquatilis]|uniref:DUF4198 domain-containing protein n=1 Tax=Ampullimonas aquatilis TaxID=1341549 RepID=UPI003C786D40
MTSLNIGLGTIFCVALALQITSACAHDAWVEARGDSYVVVYGHADKLESFSADKIKRLTALSNKGINLPVTIKPNSSNGDAVQFNIAGKPGLAMVFFDNGYWSKTTEGYKNQPKSEVPDTISASHSVKYGKTVFEWGAAVTQVQGQQLEIVPLSVTKPQAGKRLSLKVLWDGKPLSGGKVEYGEYTKEKTIETDINGTAEIPVTSGRQVISASHKYPLVNDSAADTYSASANLIFVVP